MMSNNSSAHDTPAVSIVIVSWNTRDILDDCLNSIAAQTTLSHQVIVVDNASADGTADMVRENHPDVHLIENTENRGFAAANNQGLAVATGQKLLLINPDTVVLDNAIDVMCGWLDDHPDVGCVGCQVYRNEHTIQRTGFAELTPLNMAIVEFGLQRLASISNLFAQPEYSNWDRTTERDVDVVTGMFMLVPRQVFETVGFLDEDFFVYAEEADWCKRIRNAGWRCVVAPKARILHLDGGAKSTSQIKSRMFVQLQKSKMIYARKHHGSLGAAITRSVFVASSALRGALFGTLSLFGNNKEHSARRRLAAASLRYHLTGTEPE